MQLLTLGSVTAPFTLSYANTAAVSTSSLAATITQSALQAALNLIVPGGVTVAPVSGGFTITFVLPGDQPLFGVTGAAIATTTAGTATTNAVQTLTLAGTAFTLSYQNLNPVSTTPISAGSTHAQVASALNLIVPGGVTVGDCVLPDVCSHQITFNQQMNEPLLVLDASTLFARTETQRLQVSGAVAGKFTLTFNGSTITEDYTASTLQADLNTIVPGHVTVTGSGTFTIAFLSVGNMPQLTATPITTGPDKLVAQNEQQTITLVNASSGSFTFSFGSSTHKTSALDASHTDSTLATEIQSALNDSNVVGGGVTVTVLGGHPHTFVVEFGGANAGADVATLTSDASQLVNTHRARDVERHREQRQLERRPAQDGIPERDQRRDAGSEPVDRLHAPDDRQHLARRSL